MMADPSVLPVRGADGLLSLLQILAMSYFAFVTWRAGVGRLALVFLGAVLVEAALSGMEVVLWVAGWFFPHTSGTENMWLVLWSSGTVVRVIEALALLVASGTFLALAQRAKQKSRRA
jgi:hypothetical protein